MTEDSLRCSVTSLMSIFRDSLSSVLPTAEKLKLDFSDDNQHRDWERLAETLFDVCVRGPIESDLTRVHGEMRLPRYDIDVDSYVSHSWIGLEGHDIGSPIAFIRLLSKDNPFDHAQFAALEPVSLLPIGRVVLPIPELDFILVRRSQESADIAVREVQSND